MVQNKKPVGLDHVGKRFREHLDRFKDYEIGKISEPSPPPVGYASRTFVDIREYEAAQRLKRFLIQKYRGRALEEILPGEEIRTKRGGCYHIKSREALHLRIMEAPKVREKMLSDLKLIYGIGEMTERALMGQGYRTIEDLVRHPRFGKAASSFLKLVDRKDTIRITDWIGRWFQKSHPLALFASGFHRPEDFVILDIETLGIFGRPIILFGIAGVDGGEIRISQYLLRHISEEPAALHELLSHVGENSAWITFNGRTFDVPYVRERLAYYRMRADLDRAHFDVLHFSRRAWRGRFPDCRLTTLEKCLFGIEREDDIPSGLVPEFYEAFMRTGNAGPLVPIVEHNRMDLVTLAALFSRLHEEWA
jgi:uncharacterized protein